MNKKSSLYQITDLIETYEEGLYWYLRKMLISHENSKDVLQEVFLRAWKNLDQFRGEAKISTWLYKIARNQALRFMEKEKKRFDAAGLFVKEDLLRKLSSDELISGDEIQMSLQKAILSLPFTQREVFNMRYFDEMKYEQIGEILEISVNSLKVSFHHAKNKIEELLKS